MGTTKRWLHSAALAVIIALAVAACSPNTPVTAPTTAKGVVSKDLVKVGFVAVGPEGAWREANELDIQSAFTEDNGFSLSYAPATNLSRQSQIDAFHAFIDQGVDIIVLSATEEAGWEQPLARARISDIPVVLLDRGLVLEDPTLYRTRIAPDNVAVASAVAEWAVGAFPGGASYLVLEGPRGASVVSERNQGWDSVMQSQPQFVKVAATSANWSFDEGVAATAQALAETNNGIQLIFAHNDEMGLGAAQAVESAGLTPGVDVKIATIDGTFAAMDALANGRLNFVAEYNPLFGDIALEIVRGVLVGQAVDEYVVVPSQTFDSPQAAYDALPSRQY